MTIKLVSSDLELERCFVRQETIQGSWSRSDFIWDKAERNQLQGIHYSTIRETSDDRIQLLSQVARHEGGAQPLKCIHLLGSLEPEKTELATQVKIEGV